MGYSSLKSLKSRTQGYFSSLAANRLLMIYSLLSLLLVGLLVWWLLNIGGPQQDENDIAIEQTRQQVEQLSTYPEVYKKAKLPQYPSAEVTYLGGADSQTTEPVVIYLNTSDAVDEVKLHFENNLPRIGWQKIPSRSVSGTELVTQVYEKETQEFHLTISYDTVAQVTNVIISWQLSKL